MRELTDHIVPGDSANHQLRIFVEDGIGAGGANHRYNVNGFVTTTNESRVGPATDENIILFQNGPITEGGVNGLTQEALLAIVIDRLRGFQSGNFKCRENAIALTHFEEGLMWLQRRTVERIKRNVEGTHQQ